MQMEGLIPFKSSIDQVIASVYFLRVSRSFYSSDSVNVVEIITGFAISGSKKTYFNRLGNSFKVNPYELDYVSSAFCSILHFFVLFSSILIMLILIQNWSSKIQHQEHQDTRNSSHFHSLNCESYN